MAKKNNTTPVVPAADPSLSTRSSVNIFSPSGTGLRPTQTSNTSPARIPLATENNIRYTTAGATYDTNIYNTTKNQFVQIDSGGGNPFNQDLNTFNAVEFTGITNVQEPIINNADASIANGAKIAVEHDTSEPVKQDQPLGSYVFGGSYDNSGGMTYTASINGYADNDWTSDTSAPTGIVIRTGSIGKSITANPMPNYGSWVLEYGDIGIDLNDDYGSAVAVDSNNNSYIIGADGNNGYIRFLVKFNSVGGLVWQKRLSDPSAFSYYSSADAICVDSSDNVITAVNADDSVQNSTVMKLDSNGSLLWQTKIFDSVSNELAAATIDLTTDSAGNIYGCGGVLYGLNPSTSYNRLFLYKLNSAGVMQWQRRVFSPNIGGTSLYGIVCDPSGNIYVTGSQFTQGSILADTNEKIYVAKYDSTGSELWQKIININDGSSSSVGLGITLDTSNNVIVTGRILSNFTVPITADRAGVIIKLNPEGIIQWQRIAPSIRGFHGVHCDSQNNLYTLGEINVENPAFNRDLITTKFNSSGVMQWQRTLGTSGNEYLFYYWGNKNIAVRGNHCYSTGWFYNGTNNCNVVLSRLKTDGSDTDSYGPFAYGISNVLDVDGDCVDEFITPAIFSTSMQTAPGEYVVESNNYTHSRYYKNGNIVTFGSDTVYITSDKKVGIGTKPTEQLTVAGGAKIGYVHIGSTDSKAIYIGSKIPNIYSPYNTGNIGIGSEILANITASAIYNIAIGNSALRDLTTGQYNVALGSAALRRVTTGISNIGIGDFCLSSTTTGGNNIGIGHFALVYNTIGNSNIGIGSSSLQNNTTGLSNIGIGTYSLGQNTTGSGNIGIGAYSLYNNTTGGSNNAFGYYTLNANTTGNWNTAIGNNSLSFNSTGYGNTATGNSALNTNTTGNNNTASGQHSLLANTTGSNNAAFGRSAGSNVTTGSNNVFVGYSSGTDAVANISTQSNYVVLGNDSTTNANIKVSWTVTSDARDKGNIVDLVPGLNFVNALRPKQFNLIDRASGQSTTGIRYGFLAQNILEQESSDPVLVDNSDPENLKLREAMLVPILTKAVQELSQQIEELKRQIEELKNANYSK